MGLLSDRDPKLAKSVFNLTGSAIKAGARTAWRYPKSTALVTGAGATAWAVNNAPIIAGQAIGSGGGAAAGNVIGQALYVAKHRTADFVSYPYRLPSVNQQDYTQPREVPRFENGVKVGTQTLNPADRPQWQKTRGATEREIRDTDIRLRKTTKKEVDDSIASPGGQKMLKAITASNMNAGVPVDDASTLATQQYSDNIKRELKDVRKQYGDTVVSNPETGRKAYQDRLLARRKYEGRESGLQLGATVSQTSQSSPLRRKLLDNSIDVFRNHNETRNAVNVVAKYQENPIHSSVTPAQYEAAVNHIKANPEAINALKESYRDLHSLRTKQVAGQGGLRRAVVDVNVPKAQRVEEVDRETVRRGKRELAQIGINGEGSTQLGQAPRVNLVRTYDDLKRERGSGGAAPRIKPSDLRYTYDPRPRKQMGESTLPEGAGQTAPERALSRLQSVSHLVDADANAIPGRGQSRYEIGRRGLEEPLTPLDMASAEQIRNASLRPRVNQADIAREGSNWANVLNQDPQPVNVDGTRSRRGVRTESTQQGSQSQREAPNVGQQPSATSTTPGAQASSSGERQASGRQARRRVPTGETSGGGSTYIINQPTYNSPVDFPEGSKVTTNARRKKSPAEAPASGESQGGLLNAFNNLPGRQKGLLLGGAGLVAGGAVLAGGKYLLDRAQEDKRRKDIEAYRQYV